VSSPRPAFTAAVGYWETVAHVLLLPGAFYTSSSGSRAKRNRPCKPARDTEGPDVGPLSFRANHAHSGRLHCVSRPIQLCAASCARSSPLSWRQASCPQWT
jgi:hypothetical protein